MTTLGKVLKTWVDPFLLGQGFERKRTTFRCLTDNGSLVLVVCHSRATGPDSPIAMFYVDLAVAPPLGVDFLLHEAGLQDGDVDKLHFGLWTDRLHPTDLSRAETVEARERTGFVSRTADEWSFLKAGNGEDCGIDLVYQLQKVALPRCRELLDPSALFLLAEDPRNGGPTFTYGRTRAAAILLAQRNGLGDFERALDMLSDTGNQRELADWLKKIRPSLP